MVLKTSNLLILHYGDYGIPQPPDTPFNFNLFPIHAPKYRHVRFLNYVLVHSWLTIINNSCWALHATSTEKLIREEEDRNILLTVYCTNFFYFHVLYYSFERNGKCIHLLSHICVCSLQIYHWDLQCRVHPSYMYLMWEI